MLGWYSPKPDRCPCGHLGLCGQSSSVRNVGQALESWINKNVQQQTQNDCPFHFILFYSLLFSFILFYSLLFSSILFYSLLFSLSLFYSHWFSFFVFYSLWVSLILFYSLLFSLSLFEVKPLNENQNWGRNSEKYCKFPEKCYKVWKSAETILPFSCCPLVFLWFWGRRIKKKKSKHCSADIHDPKARMSMNPGAS